MLNKSFNTYLYNKNSNNIRNKNNEIISFKIILINK